MNHTPNFFSAKISVLSFVLCCGVVSQHIKWLCRDSDYLNTVQQFWFFIVETCVPFFFMISGYLFFRTYESTKWKEKLKSRVKTLFVPYLIWNVFYAIVMVSLFKMGLITNMQNVKSLSGGVISCLNSEFSPLWFVKYLMVFVCISPLVYFVLRKKILGFLFIAFLLVVNAYNYYSGSMQVPLNVNANNWIMFIYQYIFFAIGSFSALCLKSEIEKPSLKKSRFGVIIIFTLMAIYWLYIKQFGDVVTNHTFRWLWCISIWFAFDMLPNIKVRPWMKYSFFIYCSHLIFVMCVQGVSNIVYSKMGVLKPIFQISEYLWLVPLSIYCLIKIGDALKRYQPLLWGYITGSRG